MVSHHLPRKIDDPWIWGHARPEKYNGWLDLPVFKGMFVAQGAGVGGGSLICANISHVPPKSSFADRWPGKSPTMTCSLPQDRR